jgi:hypothetical protein
MGDSPATLPADFFNQPNSAQPEAPSTLPANFFAQGSSPAPTPQASGNAPATLPADFFAQPQPDGGGAPSTLPADFFSKPVPLTAPTPSSDEGDGSAISKAMNWLNEPLTKSLLGWNTHRDGATGFEAGAEDFASGLTSPLNVGLALASFGTSALESGLVKAGFEAAEAAGYVRKAKLVADLGFLTKYGYDLGTNTLPQAQMYFNDWKNATGKDKEKALQNLEQFGTETVLNAVASGLALRGVKGDIDAIASRSAKGMAMQHPDYAKGVYDYQSENQIGSAQKQQIFNDGMKAIPDEKRQAALSHSIEAGGDAGVLEKWAQRAEQNPLTKDSAQSYRDAKQLSPKEVEVRDRLNGVLQSDLGKLKALGLLPEDGGRTNYLPHRYDFDEVDPVTKKPVTAGSDTDFLKKRIYSSYADAEQAGLKPVTKSAIRLIADYHERVENLLAKEGLAQNLASGRTSEGAPLAASSRDGATVSDEELKQIQKAGGLDKLLSTGRIKEVAGDEGTQLIWNTDRYVPSGISMQGPNGRVPLYVAPEVIPHLQGMLDNTAPNSSLIRAALKASSTAKSLLLSLSPFHWVTILNRSMEAGMNPLSSVKEMFTPKDIDYFNLTDSQKDAIKNGVVAGNTRPGYSGYLEEGTAGHGSPVNKIPIIGDFNEALEKRLFGPQGWITGLKFDLYDRLKGQLQKANPDFTDEQAGRIAAAQVNNKFGGLNYSVLGRGAQTQNAMRALLLAPDFLESTGRSVLDVAGSHGSGLVKSLVGFNAAHWLLARALNQIISGDTKPESGFAVRSHDDKKEYNIRTTLGDFLHFVEDPRGFALNRVNPMLRAGNELATGIDAQGHKATPEQQLFDTLRQTTPIPLQFLYPSQQVTQPSKAEQVGQAFGVRGTRVFSPAEQLAMKKASARDEGGPLEGDALVAAQKKYQLADSLRSAIAAKDVAARASALQKIHEAATGPDAFLSQKQANEIIKDANSNPSHLLSVTSKLSLDDAIDIFNHASILEKHQLKPLIQSKIAKFQRASAGRPNAEVRKTNQKIAEFRQASAQ